MVRWTWFAPHQFAMHIKNVTLTEISLLRFYPLRARRVLAFVARSSLCILCSTALVVCVLDIFTFPYCASERPAHPTWGRPTRRHQEEGRRQTIIDLEKTVRLQQLLIGSLLREIIIKVKVCRWTVRTRSNGGRAQYNALTTLARCVFSASK